MHSAAIDLSSIDAQFCYRWLRENLTATSDKTLLTWFVGCNFLWVEYAEAARRKAVRPLAYEPFEAVLKIAFPLTERKSWMHDVAPKYWKDPTRRQSDMIFTGVRYLKDGVPVFGL